MARHFRVSGWREYQQIGAISNYNTTDLGINRVGDYVGQNMGEVSVGGELIELRPCHHTS